MIERYDELNHKTAYTYDKVGNTDGNYGSGTEKSVKEYQRSMGLSTTGIVDELTWMSVQNSYFELAGTCEDEFLGNPLEYMKITSGFGPRNTGISGASTNHKGMDLSAKYGTPVMSTINGIVVKIDRNNTSSRGNYIRIKSSDHPDLEIILQHLSRVDKNVGDIVKKGDVVGLSGNSFGPGREGQNHLHYEIWRNGVQVDPIKHL